MKRRIVSFVILMLFTLYCVATSCMGVFAAVEQTGDIKELHNMTTVQNNYKVSRCTKTLHYGVGGMATDDVSVKFRAEDGYADSSWYAYSSWTPANFGKYLVIEANLFMDENVNSFMFGTRQHNAFSASIRKNSEYSPYQWINIVVVFDIEANTTDTYVNGELIDNGFMTNFNQNIGGSLYRDIRLIFNGTVAGEAYVSGLRMYEAKSMPVISNKLYLEGYQNYYSVTVKDGVSFEETFVSADPDAEVRIYTDSTYSDQLSVTESLTEGSVIVLENNNEIRSYVVNVDNGITVEDVIDDGTIAFQRATAETVNGVFGKSASDVSQKVTTDSTLAAFSTYTWLDDEFEGYVRADFNIEPGNVTGIYIGTNVHKPVSDTLSLNSNQWNRVTVIYNTADYDKETCVGKATTYVNGVKLSTVDTIFTTLGQLRVILTGSAGSYAYIDDFKFTTYEYYPPDLPVSDNLSDEMEILNGYLIPGDGMKVSQISACDSKTKIRVFSDSLCTQELSADDEISLGNTIVLESRDKVYTYYTAYGSINTTNLRTIDDASDSFSLSRASKEGVKGLGGKDANDESIKITVTSDDNGSFNGYNDYSWKHEGYSGYLAVEFNVYPVNATPTIATNGHRAISSGVSGLVKNRWNKVALFYDAASYNGSKGKTYLYVNGEYKGSYDAQFTSGNVVRFIVNASEGAGSYLYIDDYSIYESDILPIVSVPDISPYYSTNGEAVTFEEGTTPEMLSAGRLTLRVFTDASLTSELKDTDMIQEGNVLVVEDMSKTLRFYTIDNNVTKTVLASVSDANIPSNLRIVDGTVASAYGVHGRDASDESMSIVLGNVNAYMQYLYTAFSDSRYLVMEVSAYTDNNGSYGVATNGHQLLSNNVYVKDDTVYKDQWTKFVYIFDKDTSKGSLYANGSFVSETTFPTFPTSSRNAMRFVFSGDIGSAFCIDDVVIYECDVKPAVAKAAVVPASVRYILFNSDLYLPSDIRRSQLESILEIDDETTDIKIYKDGALVEPGNDESLPDGAFMTLKRGNNLYTSYDVHITKNNTGFFYGPMGQSGKLGDGVLRIAVPIEDVADQPMVMVAGYKDGKLAYIERPVAEGYTRHITHNVNLEKSEYDSFKVFVWDCEAFMPYAQNAYISK